MREDKRNDRVGQDGDIKGLLFPLASCSAPWSKTTRLSLGFVLDLILLWLFPRLCKASSLLIILV